MATAVAAQKQQRQQQGAVPPARGASSQSLDAGAAATAGLAGVASGSRLAYGSSGSSKENLLRELAVAREQLRIDLAAARTEASDARQQVKLLARSGPTWTAKLS